MFLINPRCFVCTGGFIYHTKRALYKPVLCKQIHASRAALFVFGLFQHGLRAAGNILRVSQVVIF